MARKKIQAPPRYLLVAPLVPFTHFTKEVVILSTYLDIGLTRDVKVIPLVLFPC